jgi:hypothetical protein
MKHSHELGASFRLYCERQQKPSRFDQEADIPPPTPVAAPLPVEKPTMEIAINHCANRNFLASRSTHDEVFTKSGTVVTVKGRSMDPAIAAAPDAGRPLYLHLTAPNAEQLNRGAALINAWVKAGAIAAAVTATTTTASGGAVAAVPVALTATSAAGTETNLTPSGLAAYNGQFLSCPYVAKQPGFGGIMIRVLVGIDSSRSGYFNPVPKLLGPRGDYMRHIETQANVTVHIMGVGAKHEIEEPLYILIVGPHTQAVENARALTESLIAARGPFSRLLHVCWTADISGSDLLLSFFLSIFFVIYSSPRPRFCINSARSY